MSDEIVLLDMKFPFELIKHIFGRQRFQCNTSVLLKDDSSCKHNSVLGFDPISYVCFGALLGRAGVVYEDHIFVYKVIPSPQLERSEINEWFNFGRSLPVFDEMLKDQSNNDILEHGLKLPVKYTVDAIFSLATFIRYVAEHPGTVFIWNELRKANPEISPIWLLSQLSVMYSVTDWMQNTSSNQNHMLYSAYHTYDYNGKATTRPALKHFNEETFKHELKTYLTSNVPYYEKTNQQGLHKKWLNSLFGNNSHSKGVSINDGNSGKDNYINILRRSCNSNPIPEQYDYMGNVLK